MPSIASLKSIISRYAASTLLAQLQGGGGSILVGPVIRLSQDPAFALTPDTDPADLIAGECNFSGYTMGGIGVTFGSPVLTDVNWLGLVFNHIFIGTVATPFVGNTIYGWWIEDEGELICGQLFDSLNPPIIAVLGQFLDLLAGFSLIMVPSSL